MSKGERTLPHIILKGKQVIIEGQSYPLALDYTTLQEKLKLLLLAGGSGAHHPKIDEEFLQDFGHKLYCTLFPVQSKLSPGPIFLDIRERGLSQLPWELIYAQGDWAAKTRGLVRIAGQGGLGAKGGSIHGPLQVLVALASPLYKPGAEENRQPALINLRSQEEIFTCGLKNKRFSAAFHIHSHISRSRLAEQLAKDYQVLHFVGHGNWGSLSLEDNYGCVDEITGTWLRENLSNSALHLALFNSCYTASTLQENSCAGIAKTLLDAGIPMVVGMQMSITERAALTFAHTFYRSLSEGKSVGDAVTVARRAISNCPDSLAWEWISPVLFIQPDALCRIYLPFVHPSDSATKSLAKVIKPKTIACSISSHQEIFVGRRRELVEILKTISFSPYQPKRAIVLKGEPGIGKTTLAIQAANRLNGRVERIICLSGRTEKTPSELSRLLVGGDGTDRVLNERDFFLQLARQLKLKIKDTHNLNLLNERILQQLAKGEKTLLIFDGMEAFYQSETISTFIKNLPLGCCSIITTCYSIYGLQSLEYELPPLSLEETLQLCLYNGAHLAEEKLSDEFYRLANGNPLLSLFFLGKLSQWLKFKDDLDSGQPDYLFSYLFQNTAKFLTDEERCLLIGLSLFKPRTRYDALAYVCGVNNVGEKLKPLADLSLIKTDDTDEKVSISALGRIWVKNLARDFPRLERYRYRQTLFMSRLVKSQMELLQPQAVAPLIEQVLEEQEFISEEPMLAEALLSDTPAQKQRLHDLLGKEICRNAMQTLTQEETNAQEALVWCAKRPHLPLLRSLLDNLNIFYTLSSQWEELIKIYKLGLQTMHQCGRLSTEAILLNNIGVIYCCLGNWSCALRYLQQSLDLKRQLGDLYGLVQSYNNLGLVYRYQGRWADALQIYQANLALFYQLNDAKGKAQTYNNLGLIYQCQGFWEKAEDCFNRALNLKEKSGDYFGKAKTLNNLGLLAHERGQLTAAEKLYRESLAIFQQPEHPHACAQTYSNLALLFYDKGDYEPSLQFYQQALVIFHRLRDTYGTAQVYNNLGLVYKELGNKEKATSFYRRSLELKQQLGDTHGMAQTYNNLGVIYKELGDREKARDFYRQSIELKYKIGDLRGLGFSYANLGFLELSCKNYKNAVKLLERAANLFFQESNEASLQRVMSALIFINLQSTKDVVPAL
ncbi:MAG: tetratricopeptide repeat protein [Candidatus Schekmanbacteria bacterium]|nr:tetratricopeptide repeat protein [Candidatus Schekmanbacteria bacterium]